MELTLPESPRARLGLGAALLILAVLAAFWPALLAGFIWDDDLYLTANPLLGSLTGLGRIWFEVGAFPQYYPLTLTGFWGLNALFGQHPLPYHLVNLALHAATCTLIWRMLVKLRLPGGELGALLASLVVAVHPVLTESVAWVSELKNCLSGLLYGTAAYQGCLALGLFPEERPTARTWWWGLLAFSGALLAKTVTATLPAALLVLVWWRRGRIGSRDWQTMAPWLVLGVGMGLLSAYMEHAVVGASAVLEPLSVADRVLIAGRALAFYFGKLLWPGELLFVYPRWQLDPTNLAQWAYPTSALAVFLLLLAYRHRLGRAPFAALSCYAGTLFPALGFLNVFPFKYSFVADHFQYHAALWMLPALALGLVGLLERCLADEKVRRAATVGVFLALCLGLAARSMRYALVFADRETLYSHVLEHNPAAFLAAINLGDIHAARGEQERAIALFRQALKTHPDPEEAHFNIGNSLLQLGRTEEALMEYETAVRLRPAYAQAQNNRAVALTRLNRPAEALKAYEAAVAEDPGYDGARMALIRLAIRLGRNELALTQIDALLNRLPRGSKRAVPLLTAAGEAALHMGRADLAAGYFRRGLSLAPGDQGLAKALKEAEAVR